ncbi:MAG: ABC transporter ATP-binding protein [Xanthobacteraceae bacterium]|nr:ABC transporter ATP-binding protein [Xanthobacteraceae bacterium]
MTAEPKLHVGDVVVRLGDRLIVDGASLDLAAGKLTMLIGPNGAGKTTLMRALAGLVPAEGRIDIGGRPLAALTPRDRARRIAYLPQGHVFHWPMPVAAVVALGRYPYGDAFSPVTDADRRAVAKALAATGTEGFASRAVTTLSGGERARVALARALACEAPILLADEPTVSLDPRHQLVVMELLARAAHNGGAVLAIVHDLAMAARFADRIVIMDRGRLIADGAPRDVLTAERIAAVFGVEALMVDDATGRHPVLLRPI